jgi:hypothetical protein
MSPARAIAWSDPARHRAFERWLAGVASLHGLEPASLEPASADASFRRYLRVQASRGERGSLIVMDAPPPHEDMRPFVRVARWAAAAGLNVPRVLECDEAQGFLLLSDLGRRSYLDALGQASAAEADRLMRDALAALVRWQLGVFCRLKHRDGEPRYAEDLPRFFAYCTKVALRYAPLAPLLPLLEPLSGQRVASGFTF